MTTLAITPARLDLLEQIHAGTVLRADGVDRTVGDGRRIDARIGELQAAGLAHLDSSAPIPRLAAEGRWVLTFTGRHALDRARSEPGIPHIVIPERRGGAR